MKRRFIIYNFSFILMFSMVTACGENDTIIIESTNESTSSTFDSIQTNDIYYYEATSSAALTVKMEADMYFAENKVGNKVIHGCFKNDGAFGSVMINRHPALEGLEYIIELNNENNAVNVFLCQLNTNPVTIACKGKYDKIEEWDFSSWEEILDHYELSNDNESN